jgi:Kef-type K+ transport system membrane component KefB
MMRIPGFQAAIFPTAAMPNLNLVANLGLILFLFLVGLEVNMRMFMSNWRVALSVGLAGMILPFGLGSAIAFGLYHQFRSDPGIVAIDFGVYLLFIGTALSVSSLSAISHSSLIEFPDYRLPSSLSNPYRIEASEHTCRRYGSCCWSW